MGSVRNPTPGQVRLLQSIADGNVVQDIGDERIWEVGYIVTRPVGSLYKRGWCEPVSRPDGELMDWVLTDAGRTALAQAGQDAAGGDGRG